MAKNSTADRQRCLWCKARPGQGSINGDAAAVQIGGHCDDCPVVHAMDGGVGAAEDHRVRLQSLVGADQ